MTKFKGITVQLGDKDFVIPPLSFRALQELQDRLSKFNGGVDAESVALVVDATYAALRRNYPDVVREELLDLLDVGNMQDVMTAVMDVSGLLRKQKEAQAADPSIGPTSTPT